MLAAISAVNVSGRTYRLSGELEIDRDEIADWRYVRPDTLTAEIAANADAFTPWLKLEWPRVSGEFLDQILAART